MKTISSASLQQKKVETILNLAPPTGTDFQLVDLGPDIVETFFQQDVLSDDSLESQQNNHTRCKKKRKRPSPDKSGGHDVKVQVDEPEGSTQAKSFPETKGGRKLWEFLLGLLCNPQHNPSLIKWHDMEDGVFVFTNSGKKAACLWGQRRGHSDMTYEHMSRAIRHYYKSQVILRVPGRRLVYQFGPNAKNWRDRVENARCLFQFEEKSSGLSPEPRPPSKRLCRKHSQVINLKTKLEQGVNERSVGPGPEGAEVPEGPEGAPNNKVTTDQKTATVGKEDAPIDPQVSDSFYSEALSLIALECIDTSQHEFEGYVTMDTIDYDPFDYLSGNHVNPVSSVNQDNNENGKDSCSDKLSDILCNTRLIL